MPQRSVLSVSALAFSLALAACEPSATAPDGTSSPEPTTAAAPTEAAFSRARGGGTGAGAIDQAIRSMLVSANDFLAAEGEPFRADRADWIAAPSSDEIGRTVFFEDRTLRLEDHFVPRDPRRGGEVDITWQFDQSDGVAAGLTLAETEAAVERAMATWDGARCSTLPLERVPDFGLDLGVLEFILTGGAAGSPFVLSDITHAGFGSLDFLLPPEVLAVTVTFVFVDEDDNPTDIDRDGRADVAFREIYYNNQEPWGIDTTIPFDVETVALHEAGHGLSQGHFGSLFRTDANGFFHFAPRAVMNAGYTGVQQDLAGTDRAGHCSIWSSWPRR